MAVNGSVNPLAPMAFVDLKAKADGVELTGLLIIILIGLWAIGAGEGATWRGPGCRCWPCPSSSDRRPTASAAGSASMPSRVGLPSTSSARSPSCVTVSINSSPSVSAGSSATSMATAPTAHMSPSRRTVSAR
jgi:hypothetical protein